MTLFLIITYLSSLIGLRAYIKHFMYLYEKIEFGHVFIVICPVINTIGLVFSIIIEIIVWFDVNEINIKWERFFGVTK